MRFKPLVYLEAPASDQVEAAMERLKAALQELGEIA
jgi:hypothetical protein